MWWYLTGAESDNFSQSLGDVMMLLYVTYIIAAAHTIDTKDCAECVRVGTSTVHLVQWWKSSPCHYHFSVSITAAPDVKKEECYRMCAWYYSYLKKVYCQTPSSKPSYNDRDDLIVNEIALGAQLLLQVDRSVQEPQNSAFFELNLVDESWDTEIVLLLANIGLLNH